MDLVKEMLEAVLTAARLPARAVLLVPQANYENAQGAFAICCDLAAGTVGRKGATVLHLRAAGDAPTPSLQPYDLYLVGWETSRPADQNGLRAWMGVAARVS